VKNYEAKNSITKMDRRQIEELLAFYALGAISEQEKELVEAYLEEHPEARQQLEEMQRGAAALPYSISPVEPSLRSKELLMKRVSAEPRAIPAARNQPSSARGTRRENFFRAFSLGAAGLAILWAVILNAQVAGLRSEIAALRQALAAQSSSIEQINAALPQLAASKLMTVILSGTDVQPQAKGQLIADPDSQSAVLVITNLTPLQAGKTYQVWLIKGDTPQSAGLLTVDETGQGVLVMTSKENIGLFDALGISIEPGAGSPQPTGEIVVLSNL
jgi:anti-sigma-K factor RskA